MERSRQGQGKVNVMEIVGSTGRKGLGIHSLALGSVQILRDPLSDAPGIHVL